MRPYLNLLKDIKTNGALKSNRTGVDTLSVFGRQLRFDLQKGFPLLTTKKMFLRGIIYELLWELNGDSNIKYLNDNGVHIWDEWADKNGDLGPVYGVQWRAWQAEGRKIDQLAEIVERIKTNPDDRRLIVSAWNVGEINKMALPPCHCFFQFYVAHGRLSCQMYQRSCDVFLGVPFNIASYSLLIMLVAKITGLEPGEFVHTFGDVHIYVNHLAQVNEQLKRRPRHLPKMLIKRTPSSLFDFRYDDFELIGYNPHPPISAPIAV